MPAPLNVKLGLKTEEFDRGLAGIGARVQKALGSAFGGAGNVAQKFLPILGTFASVGAAISEVKSQIDDAREWERLSRRTGIATSTLRGLGGAARTVGGEVGDMVGIIRKLDLSASRAQESTSKQAKALRDLGIGAGEWAALAPEERLYRLADALHQSTDATKAQRDAFELGGRKALEMFQVLRQGSDALKKGGGPLALDDAATKELDAVGGKVQWLAKLMKNSIGTAIVGWGRQIKTFGADIEFVKNLLGGKGLAEAREAYNKSTDEIFNPKAAGKPDGPAYNGPDMVTVTNKRDPRTKLTLQDLASSSHPEAAQAREVLRLEAQAKAEAARGNDEKSGALFARADVLRHGDRSEIQKAKDKEAEAAALKAKALRAVAENRPNDGKRAYDKADEAAAAAAEIRERLRSAAGGASSEDLRNQAEQADARFGNSPQGAVLRAQAEMAERRSAQRAALRKQVESAEGEAGRLSRQYREARDGGASPAQLGAMSKDAGRMGSSAAQLRARLTSLEDTAGPSAAELRAQADAADRAKPRSPSLEGDALRARAGKLESGLTSLNDGERDPLRALVTKQEKANGLLEDIKNNTEDLDFDNQ